MIPLNMSLEAIQVPVALLVVLFSYLAARLVWGGRSTRAPPMAVIDPWLPPVVSHTRRLLMASAAESRATMWQLVEKYGNVFQLQTVLGKSTFLTGPEALRWAFRSESSSLEGACLPAHWLSLLGEHSLSCSVGEYHKRMRRVWTAAFSPALLARAAPIILRTAQDALAALSAASAAGAVDAHPVVKSFALDVVLIVLLGTDSKSDARLATIGHDFWEWLGGLGTLLPVNLPFTALGRAMSARQRIHDALRLFIRERRAEAAPGAQLPRNDVLQLFMDARDEAGRPLEEPVLLDHALNFIFAGHDTSAATACTMLYCLAKLATPDAVATLRAEVARVLPEAADLTADGAFEAFVAAPYVEAFVKEALRIASPVPGMSRRVTQSLELSCPFRGATSTYTLPKGSMITLDFAHQKSNPEYYPQPDSFCPERFLPGRDEDKAAPYSYLPFGGGARMCVGMQLAKLELKLFLAVLVRDYEVAVDSFEHLTFPLVFYRPHVRVTRRVAAAGAA